MDLFEAIGKRASYRKTFTDAPVPMEDLKKIVEAGIKAPSGMNKQGTFFVIVTNEGLRKQISELISTPATQTAPAILVIASRPMETPFGTFEVEDYAAAVENVLLAITALGYAGVWMDGLTKKDGNNEKLKEMLGIDDSYMVRTIIPLGVPAEDVPQAAKMTLEERALIKD